MELRRLATSIAIACSALLLFLIQPMIAKTLLPRFGGSAGVWITCMMFFQVVLLLGYLYSFWITRYPGPKVRTAVHLALLAISLAMLPVRPHTAEISGSPTVSILLLLGSSIGLPFFLLSTTTPLVQSWQASSLGKPLPYRLYALSNFASLLALLAYPLVIEPAVTTSIQLRWWSGGYLVVALLLMGSAVGYRASTFDDPIGKAPSDSGRRPLLWIALAACASVLWLAVANYLSHEVAAIPFLWVLPMTVYLLSFVLCFGWDRAYRRWLFRWLLPAAWIAISLRMGLSDQVTGLGVDLAVMSLSLLVLCLFLHGELARSRPVSREGLPFFYLMAATGGAIGGVFVAVVAPAVFSSYAELPVGVVASVFLGVVLTYGITSRARLMRLALVAIAAFVVASTLQDRAARVKVERNFYGTLQVSDSGEGDRAVRTLYNGRTAHGAQFLSPALRRTPTAYYGTRSGIGFLLSASAAPNRRIAIVGLGAGTLAAYGRQGDLFRFYEINPAVVRAASEDFHFLADSAAAIGVSTGDGRLLLEKENPHSFDLIVLDAFSDDAIPVHLLTREAFQLYFERLEPGGSLAVHTSNRYLDLNPVVEALAAALGKRAVRIHSPADPQSRTFEADWAIVSDGPALPKRGPLWTDDYGNLFQVWR